MARRREELQPLVERRLRHLENCLEKLPSPQRSLIHGYYYERSAIDGLAEKSGRTVAATYKMLQRVRHALEVCVERFAQAEGV